ncbi:glucosaminidase domain-containing protein [Pelagibacteraceae bacterium]|nr:glucosaminidase domain-containing protein [Pelagibacteraceae bacterium]
MHKYFFSPLIIAILALAIPTIAFEDNDIKLNIKFELNAELDELVLNYCNTYDSHTINKLYSEKDILKNDRFNIFNNEKIIVKIRNKPLNPNILFDIKVRYNENNLTSLTELDVSYLNDNKKKFVRTVLPLIINENQKILSVRNNLLLLKNKLINNYSLNKSELQILKKLSKNHKIKFNNSHKLDVINNLLKKVDIIPNSIVLAQAAIESGWGSSRFAQDFNALFGEYTYDNNKGVVPLKRENGENHLIKAFNSYNSSVESYFNNINSHYAYEQFRKLREVMRERNNFSNVTLLVDKLDTYAEDENYIQTIKSVIKNNNFEIFDKKIISY